MSATEQDLRNLVNFIRTYYDDATWVRPAVSEAVKELLFLRRVISDMAEEGRAVDTLARYRNALEAIANDKGGLIMRGSTVIGLPGLAREALESKP